MKEFRALLAAAFEMPASFAIFSTSSAFVIALSSFVVVNYWSDKSIWSLIKHSVFKSQGQIHMPNSIQRWPDGIQRSIQCGNPHKKDFCRTLKNRCPLAA
jgi:hypothetical protein